MGKRIVPDPVGVGFSTCHTINDVVVSVKRVIILIRHTSNLIRLKGAQERRGELMGEIRWHLMEVIGIYVNSHLARIRIVGSGRVHGLLSNSKRSLAKKSFLRKSACSVNNMGVET